MEKGKFFVLLIFILSFLLISSTIAQLDDLQTAVDTNKENLENKVEQTRNVTSFISGTSNETSSQALGREWTSFLRTNKAFSWIYKLDPIFKFLLGQEFSLSWRFFTGLALWAIILYVILWGLDELLPNRLFVLLVGVIMSGLISRLAISKILDKTALIFKDVSDKVIKFVGPITFIAALCLLLLVINVIKIIKEKIKAKRLEEGIETAEAVASATNKAVQNAKDLKEGMDKEEKEIVEKAARETAILGDRSSSKDE